jgi:hypothetical protein
LLITALAVRDGALLATNDKNERYILDRKARKVDKVKKGQEKKP